MLFWIAIGAGIATFGIHNIHERTGITEGGVIGMMLFIHHWSGLPAGWITPVLMYQCYLLALRFLGTPFYQGVHLVHVLRLHLFIISGSFSRIFLPDLSDLLAAAVFGGIFVGIGVGLIVRQGGSSGGDDALALSISKVTHWRLSRCYLFTDLVVLGLSISYIPIIHIVFSVVTVTLSSFLIDLVMMYGRDSQKKIINTSRSEQEC